MYTCKTCGAFSAATADPPAAFLCPACGAAEHDTTIGAPQISVGADAHAPAITSLLSWSTVWLEIAHDAQGAAIAARARYSTDASTALADEFKHGLVAVTAAATAITAEQIFRTGSDRASPAGKPLVIGRKATQGDYLGLELQQKSLIDAATAASLGELFALRHSSIHPHAEHESLALHPIGTQTSPEIVAFNADIVREFLVVADAVVDALQTLPTSKSQG